MNNCTIISIEGVIGCGKSTVVSMLKERFCCNSNVYFFDEPLDYFENYILNGEKINPLEEFYKDKKLNSYPFQMYVLDCYNKLMQTISKTVATNKHCYVIMDRNIYSSQVFCNVLQEQGYISTFGLDLFSRKMGKTISHHCGKEKPFGTDKIFFIDLPLNICQNNLKRRQRRGEMFASDMETYQLTLRKSYQKYIDNFSSIVGSRNVLFSKSTNLEEIVKEAADFISEIIN